MVLKFKQGAMDVGLETEKKREREIGGFFLTIEEGVLICGYQILDWLMSELHGIFQILKLFAKHHVYVYLFLDEGSRGFIRFSQFTLKKLRIIE